MPHNHKCSCDHEDVKFCKCCNTVYCTGCNQEWAARSNYGYSWQYGLGSPTFPGGNVSLENTKTISTGSLQPLYADAQKSCEHKA